MNIMEFNLEKCPKGKIDSTCKKVDCALQEGKWKGEEMPSLEISFNEKTGQYDIDCQDYEE